MRHFEWPAILLTILDISSRFHPVISEENGLIRRNESSPGESSIYSLLRNANSSQTSSPSSSSSSSVPHLNISSLLEPNSYGPAVNPQRQINNAKETVQPITYKDTPRITSKFPEFTAKKPITDSSTMFPPAEESTNFEDDDLTTPLDTEEDTMMAGTSAIPSSVIQHISSSHGGKTLTIPKQSIPHAVINPWDTFLEATTENSEQLTTVKIPADSEERTYTQPASTKTDYKVINKEVDVGNEPQINQIKKVSVSESIINGNSPSQSIAGHDKTREGGMFVTSVPGYHPNEVIQMSSTSELYPSGGIFWNTSHECARPCLEGAVGLVCRYKFVLEWYYTMSKACYDCPLKLADCDRKDCVVADGVKRPIVVVNRQLPGPSIEVCKGDRIVVDVENRLMEESTTIHWHGHHQRGTPYMDGVPYVTQCPIHPKSSFRYHYTADTPGTHFWHSHTGCQRADGAFGALIVRVPGSHDPHSALYDHDLSEHTIQILDWDHKLGVDKFLAHHHANGDNKPITLLVNGRGRFHMFEDVNHLIQNATYSPTARFIVMKDLRYRFRLINAGFLNCPIQLSIDNHTIHMISSDGSDIKPVEADSLVSYAGERFDFVVTANQEVGSYWMRFRGLMDCDENFKSAHQVAVLHYNGAPIMEEPPGVVSYEAAKRKGLEVNSLNVGANSEGSLVIPELNATAEDDQSLKEKPDFTFYLSYDFYELDNPHYHRVPYYGFHQVPSKSQRLLTPQFNHISLKLPPFPLLSQHKDLGSQYQFCNETTVQNCTNTYCECIHVIQVPLGAVLELFLIDKGNAFNANHPFHLHGHAFRVVAMERLGLNTSLEEVQALDKAGLIHRKLKGAPIKDTVTVPDGGFTIVRVHASNPGYWLFHCHIEFHVEVGMAVVFKVGEHEDFAPPPRGFPTCNSYLPSDDDMERPHDAGNNVEAPVISITHWWSLHSSSCLTSASGSLIFTLLAILMLSASVR